MSIKIIQIKLYFQILDASRLSFNSLFCFRRSLSLIIIFSQRFSNLNFMVKLDFYGFMFNLFFISEVFC